MSESNDVYVDYVLSEEAEIDKVLETLRELDSMVDFSKGLIQLKILTLLAKESQGLSLKETSQKLMIRYKSIADAMRKLETKELVVRNNENGAEKYKLSEKGYEYYGKLTALLINNPGLHNANVTEKHRVKDLATDLVVYGYLLDALLALGTAKNNELSLKTLSMAMKLSPHRAQTYLDMFSGDIASIKLFKKTLKPTIMRRIYESFNMNKGSYITFYRLNKEGLSLYYRIPLYIKFKNSKLAKLAVKFFGSLHPRIVLKCITLSLVIGTVVMSLILVTLLGAYSVIVLPFFLVELALFATILFVQ